MYQKLNKNLIKNKTYLIQLMKMQKNQRFKAFLKTDKMKQF